MNQEFIIINIAAVEWRRMYVCNSNLSDETHLLISSEFQDTDPFYIKESKYITESIIMYLEQIYEGKITKNIAIQEILNLFQFLHANNYTGAYFLKKIEEKTDYNRTPNAIDFLAERTINDLFSYIYAGIISGLVAGVIIEEKNFISKISYLTLDSCKKYVVTSC